MARIISATLAGAVVYYIWGMLAWMVLPIHGPTIRQLPVEQEIIEALRNANVETGVYVAPYTENAEEMADPESVFNRNHQQGPIFSVYLQQKGSEPMSARVLLVGFVIDLLASALAVCMLLSLGPCGNQYWCRVGFVAGLGIFVGLIGHFSYWNWMHFPADYTIAFVVDNVVGWTLAGLAIAALIRPATSSLPEADKATSLVTPSVQPSSEKPASPPAKKKESSRNDAITLLATLQREARFIDIVKEPLSEYSDAQVGAAARDVLRDCHNVIERLFQIQPILEEDDGAEVEIEEGSKKIRVTGKAKEGATRGRLVHHGWEAKQCEIPSWNGAKEVSLVIAQAEVEAE